MYSHNCFYYTSKPECAIPDDNTHMYIYWAPGKHITKTYTAAISSDMLCVVRVLIVTWCMPCVACMCSFAHGLFQSYGMHSVFAGTAQSVILLRSHLACAWAGFFRTTWSLRYLQTCLQTSRPWPQCELRCAADAGTGCCAAVWSAEREIIFFITLYTYKQSVPSLMICGQHDLALL